MTDRTWNCLIYTVGGALFALALYLAFSEMGTWSPAKIVERWASQ